MAEEQWSASTDPERMLAFLRGKVSDRKLRHFLIAGATREQVFRAAAEGSRCCAWSSSRTVFLGR
jgi:hypothetical protein